MSILMPMIQEEITEAWKGSLQWKGSYGMDIILLSHLISKSWADDHEDMGQGQMSKVIHEHVP